MTNRTYGGYRTLRSTSTRNERSKRVQVLIGHSRHRPTSPCGCCRFIHGSCAPNNKNTTTLYQYRSAGLVIPGTSIRYDAGTTGSGEQGDNRKNKECDMLRITLQSFGYRRRSSPVVLVLAVAAWYFCVKSVNQVPFLWTEESYAIIVVI